MFSLSLAGPSGLVSGDGSSGKNMEPSQGLVVGISPHTSSGGVTECLYSYDYHSHSRNLKMKYWASSTAIGPQLLESTYTCILHSLWYQVYIHVFHCTRVCFLHMNSPGSVDSNHVFRALSTTLSHALRLQPSMISWITMKGDMHCGKKSPWSRS